MKYICELSPWQDGAQPSQSRLSQSYMGFSRKREGGETGLGLSAWRSLSNALKGNNSNNVRTHVLTSGKTTILYKL
jgi:hypothetical protein